jgi:hypothetical protein
MRPLELMRYDCRRLNRTTSQSLKKEDAHKSPKALDRFVCGGFSLFEINNDHDDGRWKQVTV